MDREEQGGGRGTQRDVDGRDPARQRTLEEPARERVKGHSGRRVEEQAREVVATRVHPPEHVVETEGEPGERDPVAHVNRGRHPPELRGAQSAVRGIVEKIDRVVPVDKPVLENRKEGEEGQRRDAGAPRGAQPVDTALAARILVGSGQGWRMGTRST